MLLLVLVALAPPTVVAVVVAFEEREDARERAEADVLASARLAASDTDAGIDATARLLATAAHDLAAHPESEHCRLLRTAMPESTDWYSSVGAVGADGRVYCRITAREPTRPLELTNVSGSGWFRRAQQRHGFVLGEFGAEPLSREKALIGSHQIPRESRTGHGVVFVTLDLERLTRTAELNDTPPDTVFVVLDQRGTVVARVPPDGLVGRRLPDRPLVETVLGRRSGVAEVSGLDGVSRIYGFAPVAGQATGRLFVTAGRSAASAYADPNHDLRRYLLLAGLGLLAALALSYLATKLLLSRWTAAVVDSARRFGAGDLTARAPVPRGLGELSDVANALNAAAVDIERRQENQARLLAELVAAEEETRRRIAADIHDDTAQAVAAAGLRIDALAADLKDPAARETALNARTALAEANQRLRRLLFELRPPALDEAGLGAALELYLTDSFAHDGFDWTVENRLEDEPTPEVRAILYRVALEALTNVRKHAQASLVEVLLERRGVGVAVRIRDDGTGFDLPAPDAPPEPGHFGLVSMRERAEAAGGRFAMASAPGEGTTVDFWMPEKS